MMKNLDPRANKEQFKSSITEAILKEVIGSDRGQITRSVDAEYERLLLGAAIFTHIPSLTAGVVRREAMAGDLHREIWPARGSAPPAGVTMPAQVSRLASGRRSDQGIAGP